MGMRAAGVFISLENPLDYKLEAIVETFFTKIQRIEDRYPTGFDFRNGHQVHFRIYEHGLIVSNSRFVYQVLVQRDPQLLSKLYRFFGYPETLFAYMHYDSGDSFGFCYLKNGSVKRFRYSSSSDWITHDYGDPLDEELPILNGRISFEEDEDGEEDEEGELVRYYRYQPLGEEGTRSYHFINSHLACAVMKAKLGFDFYEEHLKPIEQFVTLETE